MRAAEWIDKVLTHETDHHMLKPSVVNAMAKIATLVSREELAIVLDEFINRTPVNKRVEADASKVSFHEDKDNPNWGWIVYMGADRTYHAIDYVRRPR